MLLLLPLLVLLLLLLLPLLQQLLPLLPFVLELLLLLLLQLLLHLLLPRPGLVLLPLWLHMQHCLLLLVIYSLRRQQLSHLHPRRSRHSLRLRDSLLRLLGGVLGGLLRLLGAVLGGLLGSLLGGLLGGLLRGILALLDGCLGRQSTLNFRQLLHLSLQRLRRAMLLLVDLRELVKLRVCEDLLLVKLAVWVLGQEHQRVLQHSLPRMLREFDEPQQRRHSTD